MISASAAKAGRVCFIHTNSCPCDLHFSNVHCLLSSWSFLLYSNWCMIRDPSFFSLIVTSAKVNLSYSASFTLNILLESLVSSSNFLSPVQRASYCHLVSFPWVSNIPPNLFFPARRITKDRFQYSSLGDLRWGVWQILPTSSPRIQLVHKMGARIRAIGRPSIEIIVFLLT